MMRKWPTSSRDLNSSPRKTRDTLVEALKGLCYRNKEDDQKIRYNCNKSGHFWNDYPNIQKDISFKGSLMKEKFKSKFKKCLMATWDELGDEEYSDREAEEANLALMALILSDSEFGSGYESESDEEDEVYSNISRYYIIHDFMSHCQVKTRQGKWRMLRNNLIFFKKN